jgi:uncharacterized protein (DUF362 family)
MEGVFLARCSNYQGDEVFPAISGLLRDMSFEIPPHQTVFIKPNVMSQNRPDQHSVTHFSLIEALCILFAEKNCKIQIGDSIAFYQRGLTRRAFDTTGLRAVAEKYGAEMVALD